MQVKEYLNQIESLIACAKLLHSNEIEKVIKNSSIAETIRSGFVVSVIGKPNTGKSSFVNFVSGRDVSIVTNIPGTTRDLVETLIDKNGYQIRLIDTAGLRKHKNNIEEIGIRKTVDLSKKSNLNLVFLKSNEKNQYKKIKNKIFVKSKYDIIKAKNNDKQVIKISSITGYGVDKLLNKVISKIGPKNNSEIPIISRERQLVKLKKSLFYLNFRSQVPLISEWIQEGWQLQCQNS